jgi:hypothetical protein
MTRRRPAPSRRAASELLSPVSPISTLPGRCRNLEPSGVGAS